MFLCTYFRTHKSQIIEVVYVLRWSLSEVTVHSVYYVLPNIASPSPYTRSKSESQFAHFTYNSAQKKTILILQVHKVQDNVIHLEKLGQSRVHELEDRELRMEGLLKEKTKKLESQVCCRYVHT